MNAWTACGPEMGWMWIFPLLFCSIMIGMMILFWRRGVMSRCGMMSHHEHESARQILDRRYAGGELRKEQYDEMKQSLA